MNPPVQNIAALRDIHLPEAIGWWPPAIGWWLLAIIIVLAIIFIPRIYRRFTFIPTNQVANTLLQNILSTYDKTNNKQNLVTDISRFLRQVAMTYKGREASAPLTGDEWINSLNNLTGKNYFTDEIKEFLINAPYQKTISTDPQALIVAVQNWVDALPKKPVNIMPINHVKTGDVQ